MSRVWICTQCCEIPGTPDGHACILIRKEQPDDRLDTGCPWCALYAVWTAVNSVKLEPGPLLNIGSTLSDAAWQLVSEAAGTEVIRG